MVTIKDRNKPVLRIPKFIWHLILEQIENSFPYEACGLIAGVHDEAIEVFPIRNISQNPTQFRMDPQEQLDAFLSIVKMGWMLLGIYHSHPNGLDIPSEKDIAESYYPESAYLIWSQYNSIWRCKGYLIQKGIALPIEVILENQ